MSGSWYPLAGTDPVPGDPAAVRDAARRYEAVAERITRAAADLREVAGVAGTSQAVDELRERAVETAERVAAAHDRYATAAGALDDYADGLARAQTLAQDALDAARRAALWSAVDPRAVTADLVSDLKSFGHALRDPGVFAARGPGAHVSRPVDVLSNSASEFWHDVKHAGSVAERAALWFGQADVARDVRFLAEKGADLGGARLAPTVVAAGRGVVQVVDLALLGSNVQAVVR